MFKADEVEHSSNSKHSISSPLMGKERNCSLLLANNGNYIRINLYFSGYKKIPLDAFVDTGSSRSLAKTNAIPSSFWKEKTYLPQSYAINGHKIHMGRYAQHVHIEIMGKTFITDFIEYNDLEDDVLLGFLFFKKYEPLQFWKHKI